MLAEYVDYLIAFDNENSKATKYTCNIAKKSGKKVVIMS